MTIPGSGELDLEGHIRGTHMAGRLTFLPFFGGGVHDTSQYRLFPCTPALFSNGFMFLIISLAKASIYLFICLLPLLFSLKHLQLFPLADSHFFILPLKGVFFPLAVNLVTLDWLAHTSHQGYLGKWIGYGG